MMIIRNVLLIFYRKKMDFFELSSSKVLFDYNPLIGELTIIDREKNKKYKKSILELDAYDFSEVKKHLDAATVDNKEFSLQLQDLNIKFHTLWSGLNTEQYIGVIGQIDRRG